MRADSPQWRQMGPSASDAEQHALDTLRALLPEGPLTWAWANLTFIDDAGRLSEVDIVLLHRTGLYLLELKGWHGDINGSQQTWRITRPGRPVDTVDNPLLATDRKAKRLAGLLQGVAARAKGRPRVPFVRAVTVLHGAGSTVRLDPVAAAHTYALDGAGVTGLPPFTDFLNAAPQHANDVIDKSRAKELVALLDAAGFTPTPKQRMAGQYAIDLSSPLAEGDCWVDVGAHHPVLAGQRRRIRLYDLPPEASPQQRAAVERMAKRELLLTHGLGHPGVVAALEYYDTESGPALLFPDDADAMPLAQWLDGDDPGIDTKLAVLRGVAEVMRYAHAQRVQHRALGPGKVRVIPSAEPGGAPRVTVRDWQTGRQDPGTSASTAPRPTALRSTTIHLDTSNDVDLLYLAPEVQQEHADPVALDVYGLGALAHLLITDQPPAATLADLDARRGSHGLDPTAVRDGVPDGLVELVRRATTPRVLDRTPSVEAFLADLDAAEAQLREEAGRDTYEQVVDPLDAGEGDLVGEWMVAKRLGSGSTGVALLVTHGEKDEDDVVLKVAHDAAKAARLQAEADTLTRLDHPRIVRLVQGPHEVQGRTAIVLEEAGLPTLAERLRADGALTLEQLEKFGTDLLEAVDYLDRAGVFHRDIKPDNLGVRPDPGDRRPRLVLFDFSLAGEPLDAIGSGTVPYLDPFLGPPRRPRFDSAAERFAVAVTLFEMATGRLPEWGDGLSAPGAIDAEVTVHPAMFDDAVGEALAAFFARALARDAAARFGDLTELAEAWTAVFRSIAVPADEADADEAARDVAAAAATPATLVTTAGLTARAVSAVRRLGAETVGDVVALPAMRINQVPGLGVAVRGEVQRRRAEWIERLAPSGTAADDDLPATGRGVEALLARLVPRANGKNTDAVALARAFVADADAEPGHDAAGWPTWAQVTAAAGLTGTAPAESLRAAWSRPADLAELAAEVAEVVASLGGLAAPDEVARVLLNRHGSVAEGDARLAHARLLVRAAAEIRLDDAELEVSRGRENPSHESTDRETSKRAAAGHEGSGPEPLLLGLTLLDGPDAGPRLEAVRLIAHAVDDAVAARGGVLGSAESRSLVQNHPSAAAAELSDPGRLLAVAVAASRTAALSSRGEIYPRGLSAADAVRAVLVGGVNLVTVDSLRRRVRDRFPKATRLPDRPGLDALVAAAAPSLHWSDGAYTRTSSSTSMLRTATRYTLGADLDADPVAVDALDPLLRASLSSRSGLVLAAPPPAIDAAAAALAHRYGVHHVDVTALLLGAMRDVAAEKRVAWPVVLRADAADAGSRDHQQLTHLVRLAVERCWPTVAADERPLLLTDLAPLARYGQLGLLTPLTDLATATPAARWLLVPRRGADGAPTLEGAPVPLPADGWHDLPRSFYADPAPATAVAR